MNNLKAGFGRTIINPKEGHPFQVTTNPDLQKA